MMQIIVNTDNHINGHQKLSKEVEEQLYKALDRFTEYLTRVEVHLRDENGSKPGENDKCCLLEARIKNHQPIVVSEHASSISQATTGAIDKLKRSLSDTLEKLRYK